ncbi:hypothetical protein KJ758_01760 [Patescibacteria group bacterium]|nr:hypothetical protein [Patescibacteria group bacterium]
MNMQPEQKGGWFSKLFSREKKTEEAGVEMRLQDPIKEAVILYLEKTEKNISLTERQNLLQYIISEISKEEQESGKQLEEKFVMKRAQELIRKMLPEEKEPLTLDQLEKNLAVLEGSSERSPQAKIDEVKYQIAEIEAAQRAKEELEAAQEAAKKQAA